MLISAGMIAGPINYLLVVNGLANTNLSSASFILLAEPVIVVLFASWLLKERIDKKMRLGLAIALVGASIITFGSAGLDITGVSLFGNVLIFLVIIFSALDLIITKQIIKDVSPQFLLWLMAFLTAGTTVWLIDFGKMQQELLGASALAIGGLAWGVLASTIIAYYCFYFAVKVLKAGEAGIFRYLDPIAGFMVGFLLLGEAFSPIYVLGGAIVGYGIYTVERRKRHFHKKRFRLFHHHRKHHHFLHRS